MVVMPGPKTYVNIVIHHPVTSPVTVAWSQGVDLDTVA